MLGIVYQVFHPEHKPQTRVITVVRGFSKEAVAILIRNPHMYRRCNQLVAARVHIHYPLSEGSKGA